MLEWDILNYLKKWRTNLRATTEILIVELSVYSPLELVAFSAVLLLLPG